AAHVRQAIRVGDAALVEDDLAGFARAEAHLAVDARRLEPLHAALDDEPLDRLVVPVVDLRPDDGDVRERRARDPHLRPGDYPRVAVFSCARGHRPGIGAAVGLGETEAADHLPLRHLGEILLLLLFASVRPDGVHRERPLDAHEAPETAVAVLELLQD